MPEQSDSFSTETSGLSPLRRFKSILQSIKKETRMGNRGPYDVAIFSFTDVEVLESTEPYPFPTAQLQISHSTRTETRWAAFADSIRRLFGEEEGATTDPLVGKKQEWAMLPAPTRRPVDLNEPQGDWETQDTDCWQVVSVEGAAEAAADLSAHILELLDGVPEAKSSEVLLADKQVMASPDTINAITGRALLPALLASGALMRDEEGVLHKA